LDDDDDDDDDDDKQSVPRKYFLRYATIWVMQRDIIKNMITTPRPVRKLAVISYV